MAINKGKLYIVGIGPGDSQHITPQALKAIKKSNVIVGYTAYINLITPLCKDKIIIASGMGKEIERCEAALKEAILGKKVALISSGDSGLYGMAGLVMEIALKRGITDRKRIEIVPGIPAFVAAAALIGAPIMNDCAVISLSDLLTPWNKIEQRLKAAARGDFVLCLYNPQSNKRVSPLKKAQKIFLKYRKKTTPCAILRNVSRPEQKITVTTLDDMLTHTIDMSCILIIGNSETTCNGTWMITPRGYKLHNA